MSTIKNNNFPLRFRTNTQKNAAKRLANKHNSKKSLNEYLLHLIDAAIENSKKENNIQ